MTQALLYAQLVAGFIYLLGGGDLLVRGGVGLARRYRVPPVVVALTVVSLGTSLPELMVSIRASLGGYPNLILGNVVGSNIANVLLVGGAAAAVYPLRLRDEKLKRTGLMMLGVSVVFAALCLDGEVTRMDGALLLFGLVIGLIMTLRTAILEYAEADTSTPLDWVLGLPTHLSRIIIFMGIGAVTLPLGADMLVEAAVEIAADLGVSETVIGLTIVAVGTSLPEVSTTVLAALQRRPGMAVGTIIGSNTLNLLAIMGLAAAVSPVPVLVSARFLSLDVPVMLGVSAVLVALAWFARRLGRGVGVAFLVAYVGYLTALYLTL